MAAVLIENLVKQFPEKSGNGLRAVNQINLSVAHGEFMVLVGPSGCGKSTTLRMIAGLEEISGGTIRIDEKVVNDVLPKDRDIAMVFQNYALYPHMTVYENMAFGLRLRNIPTPEIEARVKDVAETLGLSEHLDRKPKTLSGGQRQRVAVGRAIVRQPKVFLFDEPLSNLDAKMRVGMRAEIIKLHHRLRATIIYVTHDQVEAMTMGDRICVMRAGDIMQVAEPLELYNRPANLFVAGFIGSPSMNFFEGKLRADGGMLQFVAADGSAGDFVLKLNKRLSLEGAAYVNGSVILGIRPEHIQLSENSASAFDLPQTFEVEVDHGESTGAETYLHVLLAGQVFIVRVSPTSVFNPQQKIRISFDLTQVHLFDAVTEHSLRNSLTLECNVPVPGAG